MSTSQVSDLVEFVADVAGTKMRVEQNLGEGYVRLRVDEAERRQAKHDIRCVEDAVIELLRNSRDAGAHHIYVATSREANLRTTTIIDDGSGIPDDMKEHIFEARVTSKLDSAHMDRWGVHGRGMALYSVRENSLSAKVVDSAPEKGTAIQLVTDANALPERTDQSSWPTLGCDDDGEQSVTRGPHNIIRSCCEFALEEHDSCEVYVGSPAEVVATARHRVRPSVSAADLLFLDDLSSLPLLERLRVAADARELRSVAQNIGLELSERTIHRILSGQIKPLRNAYARLAHKSSDFGNDERAVNLLVDRRGLRIARNDREEFLRMMERDFAFLSKRYYLDLAEGPKLNVGHGRITVSFKVSSEG